MNSTSIYYRLVAVVSLAAALLSGMLYLDRQAASAGIPDQAVLFSDDFSGDLSQWSIQTGEWYIAAGALVGHDWTADYDTWIYAGETAWTDYALQATVFLDSPSGALVVRSSGYLQNEYRIIFFQDVFYHIDTYKISKYQDGSLQDLTAGFVPSPIDFTNPILLKVLVKEDRLVVLLNGQLMADIYDPHPLPAGRIGLGVMGGGQLRFDDVLVTSFPPVLLMPPTQSRFVTAGEATTYTLEVENHTGSTSSFNLEVLPGHAWPVSLPLTQVGPLADGESLSFTVVVQVPSDAAPGLQDIATIQAAPVASPSLTASATLTTVATSGELAYVAMQYDRELALSDTVAHIVLGKLNLAPYGCLSPYRSRLSPDGSELYVLCVQGATYLILDTSDQSLIASISQPLPCTRDIVFVQEGAYALASGSSCTVEEDYDITVIDTQTHTIVQTIDALDYELRGISAHPAWPQAYVAGGRPGSTGGVLVIDTDDLELESIIPYGEIVSEVMASPDGQWLYVLEATGHDLAKIDLSSGTVVDTAPITGYGELEISPDGSTLYASAAYEVYGIYALDTETLDIIKLVDVVDTLDMDLTCDGSELYVTWDSWSIFVVETQDLQITHYLDMPGDNKPYGVTVCPDYDDDVILRKTVEQAVAHLGELVDYTLTATNISLDTIEDVQISDALPEALTYAEGTLSASSGTVDVAEGVITWSGSIPASQAVTVSFGAEVSTSPSLIGTSIVNEAVLTFDGETISQQAAIDVEPFRVYLPCAYRPCLPELYTDDFSDPTSGWEIEETTIYKLAYLEGEYQILVKPEGYIVWSMQDFGVSDFQVEVDVRPVKHLNGAQGLMFSVSDQGFYLFEVSDGWYGLWRADWNTWSWTTLIDWTTSSAIKTGFATNHLTVVRDQGRIELAVNGVQLATLNDTAYMGTWIALVSEAWADKYDTRFDNFSLKIGCLGVMGEPGTVGVSAFLPPAGCHPLNRWLWR